MTAPTRDEAVEPQLPAADTVVLLHRKLHTPARPSPLSLFGDDRWSLQEGQFEQHRGLPAIQFTAIPTTLRDAAKHYMWQLINHRPSRPMAGTTGRRLSLRTIVQEQVPLTAFLTWLHLHKIEQVDTVTPQDLDLYLDDVIALELDSARKAGLLGAVRRLWSYRDRLPAAMRLPAAPPWGGQTLRTLLGAPSPSRENRTPRIAADTIEALLLWSLRFVDDFSTDIIDAFAEHVRLWARSPQHSATRRTAEQTQRIVADYLDQHRTNGGALPGVTRDGNLAPNWAHLIRVLDLGKHGLDQGCQARALIADSGLPIAATSDLNVPIAGRLHAQPWRSAPIGYHEATGLAELLRTACFVVIAYLTGMRPGEILHLERGCVHHDPTTGLWTIRGRKFKGAHDADGEKIPEGQDRDDPWTTVAAAGRAVAVLERLHSHRLLFATQLHPGRFTGAISTTRAARNAGLIAHDTTALMNWVNEYTAASDHLHEQIPTDPHGAISPSRLRRTLAWHIVRRPRGLIAGAIQYGHLNVMVTLGYSGTYDSGFPTERAYEDWLHRIDRLADDHQRLTQGEHVSGPAADVYRHRINNAHATFAGRVLTTHRQALDLIANPLLQIYPGKAMTCAFDPAKALCQMRSDHTSTRQTPDQDDCRPNCRNIAYTDRDIDQLHTQADELRAVLTNYLAPSPRHHRERAELDRITTIIRHHGQGR